MDASKSKALYNKAGESRVVFTEDEERQARAAGFTEPYTHQEYPKSLYVGGKRDGNERTVANADEEKAARAEGYSMIDKDADARSLKALGLDKKSK